MDDRFRRDATPENMGDITSNSIREDSPETQQNAVTEEGASSVGKINPTGHKVKRFEVHIPESSDFFAEQGKRNDVPTRIPAPQERPGQPSRPVRRPAANPGMLPRRPATGMPNPVSPETQLAARKAAERKAKEADRKKKKQALESEKLEAKKSKDLKKAEKHKEKNKNFGYNFAKGVLTTGVCLIFISTVVALVSSIAFGFINDVLVVDSDKRIVALCRNSDLVVGETSDVNLVVSFIEVRDNVVALTACVDEGVAFGTRACAEVDEVVACARVNRDVITCNRDLISHFATGNQAVGIISIEAEFCDTADCD